MGNKASSAAAPSTATQKLTLQEELMLSKGIKRAPRDVSRKLETGGLVWNMKIVIRGAPSTGKTSLIRALQEKPFEPVYNPTKEIETHHIDWSYKVTSEVVLVEAWDVIDSAQDKLVPISSLPKDHPALSVPHDAPGPSPIGRRSSVKNMVELPCLDSSKIDVYKNANAVVVLVDRTRLETFEYARKICEEIPPSLDLLILCSFRDHPAQRVVTDAHIEALLRPNPAFRRCIDVSFSNLFGLRQFQSFLNLPFLRMKQEFLEQQLSQTRNDMQTAGAELDMLLEQSYDLYLQQATCAISQQVEDGEKEDGLPKADPTSLAFTPANDSPLTPQQKPKGDDFASFSALGNEVATAAVLDDFFGDPSDLSSKTAQPAASTSHSPVLIPTTRASSSYASNPVQPQQTLLPLVASEATRRPIVLGEGDDALDDFYDGITVDKKASNTKRKSTSPRNFYGDSSESGESSESETDSGSDGLSEDEYDLEGGFEVAASTKRSAKIRAEGNGKDTIQTSADFGTLFSESTKDSELLNNIQVNQKIAEAFRSAEMQAAAEAAAILAAQEAAAFDAAASLFEGEDDDELVVDGSTINEQGKETIKGTQGGKAEHQEKPVELENDDVEDDNDFVDDDDDELDLSGSNDQDAQDSTCDLVQPNQVEASKLLDAEADRSEAQNGNTSSGDKDETASSDENLKEDEQEIEEQDEIEDGVATKESEGNGGKSKSASPLEEKEELHVKDTEYEDDDEDDELIVEDPTDTQIDNRTADEPAESREASVSEQNSNSTCPNDQDNSENVVVAETLKDNEIEDQNDYNDDDDDDELIVDPPTTENPVDKHKTEEPVSENNEQRLQGTVEGDDEIEEDELIVDGFGLGPEVSSEVAFTTEKPISEDDIKNDNGCAENDDVLEQSDNVENYEAVDTTKETLEDEAKAAPAETDKQSKKKKKKNTKSK